MFSTDHTDQFKVALETLQHHIATYQKDVPISPKATTCVKLPELLSCDGKYVVNDMEFRIVSNVLKAVFKSVKARNLFERECSICAYNRGKDRQLQISSCSSISTTTQLKILNHIGGASSTLLACQHEPLVQPMDVVMGDSNVDAIAVAHPQQDEHAQQTVDVMVEDLVVLEEGLYIENIPHAAVANAGVTANDDGGVVVAANNAAFVANVAAGNVVEEKELLRLLMRQNKRRRILVNARNNTKSAWFRFRHAIKPISFKNSVRHSYILVRLTSHNAVQCMCVKRNIYIYLCSAFSSSNHYA